VLRQALYKNGRLKAAKVKPIKDDEPG
jgi:hypothetical protein